MTSTTVEVNGREYSWPQRPIVVICMDGSEPAYHEEAIASGRMPFLAGMRESGFDSVADGAVPSFTNPNNLSIATGVPTAFHGICGNYFYDRDEDSEIMMDNPSLLRAPTIFEAFSHEGAKVAVVTAKDKLRRLLGNGIVDGICFSSEKANETTMAEHGIENVLELTGMPQPSVYSAELSEFALAAGIAVLKRDRPDIMYVSLTDYIQHKVAPGAPESNDFYAMMDTYFTQFDAYGAVLVLTADHGMNAKTNENGEPNVIYLQPYLDEWFGKNAARLILPITDPYVSHHGALGSFATLYAPDSGSAEFAQQRLSEIPGIELVLSGHEAAERFTLPPDRIGDVVIFGDRDTCIGTSPDRHDLSQLHAPLRSHGGLYEVQVPFIVNRKLAGFPERHHLRNYDAFWIGMNHAQFK